MNNYILIIIGFIILPCVFYYLITDKIKENQNTSFHSYKKTSEGTEYIPPLPEGWVEIVLITKDVAKVRSKKC